MIACNFCQMSLEDAEANQISILIGINKGICFKCLEKYLSLFFTYDIVRYTFETGIVVITDSSSKSHFIDNYKENKSFKCDLCDKNSNNNTILYYNEYFKACSECKTRLEIIYFEGTFSEFNIGVFNRYDAQPVFEKYSSISEIDEANNEINIQNDIIIKTHSLKDYHPKILIDFLNRYVISQNNLKEKLAMAIYTHKKRIILKDVGCNIKKSNILIIGETGSGKTHTITTLTKHLQLPYVIGDATSFTSAGYYGGDLPDLCIDLLDQSNNQEEAEQGLIYLDEIDKIAKPIETSHNSVRDVEIQRALLKMMEGSVVNLEVTKRQFKQTKPFNTENLLWIFSGAFEGLSKIIEKRNHKTGIGFTANTLKAEKINTLNKVIPEDLIEYGFLPEFVGRLGYIVVLNHLTEDDFIAILTKTDDNLLAQQKIIYSLDGISLSFTKTAIQTIANIAYNRKAGARGLANVIDEALFTIMFEHINEIKTIKRVVITAKKIKQALKC